MTRSPARSRPSAFAPVRILWNDHLVDLVGRSAAAATRLAGAPAQRRVAVAARSRREAARLSARLDASPLTDETAAAVDDREAEGLPPVLALHEATVAAGQPDRFRGNWLRALRLDEMPTQDVAAVEYANLLACADAEPRVAPLLMDAPLEALALLHAEICRGLVDPEVIARPRRTSQAIHDGAEGRVLYHAPEPEALPGLLEGLASWLTTSAGALPAVVVAAVVHERLLEWQPFEAGNGRLARATARAVLRAGDVDPAGVAVPERYFAADPFAYYTEVAATQRRRDDLTLWIERAAEAVVTALEDAAAEVDPRPGPAVPRHAAELVAQLPPGGTVTVTDYAQQAGVSPARAREDLRRLVAAGALRQEPRSRGLRFRLP